MMVFRVRHDGFQSEWPFVNTNTIVISIATLFIVLTIVISGFIYRMFILYLAVVWWRRW